MARRLVEAGASFVTMVMENPSFPGESLSRPTATYNWDSHAVNCHIFNDPSPAADVRPGVTALIEDLYARGLDRKVLLIVTGEFGRTPRITYADRPARAATTGRRRCRCSCPAAACTGQVIGSTNSQRRTSQGSPADAERPVGDDVPAPRHRSRQTSSSITPAGPCRFCHSAIRSRNWCDFWSSIMPQSFDRVETGTLGRPDRGRRRRRP